METPKEKELKKELTKIQSKLKKEQLKEINEETGFRIGDEVEFEYHSNWRSGEIIDLRKHKWGIEAIINGCHDSFSTKRIKKFNKNDYSFRHSLWNRELQLDDKVQLIIKKPKSTVGKIYSIFRIVKEVGCIDVYWYYNDEGKLQTLHEEEYHLTHE